MSRKLRHGFKAEAEYYAGLYRHELGLDPHAPLCPRRLAEHLAVPIKELSTHPGVPKEIKDYWQSNAEFTFSGLIITDGAYKEIVHNDFHHARRQNSNIAHELAHIILGHPLAVPILSNGERAYDPEIEEEAKWLGATLLLPKKSTVHIVLHSLSLEYVQQEYGVSSELIRYRVQVTDARGCARNIRRKRGFAA